MDGVKKRQNQLQKENKNHGTSSLHFLSIKSDVKKKNLFYYLSFSYLYIYTLYFFETEPSQDNLMQRHPSGGLAA